MTRSSTELGLAPLPRKKSQNGKMGWLAREGVEDGNDHPYELGEQVFNLYVPNSSPVCRRVARLSGEAYACIERCEIMYETRAE